MTRLHTILRPAPAGPGQVPSLFSPVEPARRDGDDPDSRPPGDPDPFANLVVLVAMAIFVVGCTWLLIRFRESTRIQDCVLAGHHHCVPLEIPQR